jgi:hypothetical protein
MFVHVRKDVPAAEAKPIEIPAKSGFGFATSRLKDPHPTRSS